jgi:hypothetical protein
MTSRLRVCSIGLRVTACPRHAAPARSPGRSAPSGHDDRVALLDEGVEDPSAGSGQDLQELADPSTSLRAGFEMEAGGERERIGC